MKIITGATTDLKESARKSMEDSIMLLISNSVNVICEASFFQNFAVIDNQITWYGNVSLLGYDLIDTNVLRLIGSDIAMQLRNALEV